MVRTHKRSLLLLSLAFLRTDAFRTLSLLRLLSRLFDVGLTDACVVGRERLERGAGALCAKLDPSTFDTDVLGSAALWIILYHGGLKDMKSAEAKVNFLRLASDLEGRARLGMLDCEAHAAHCRGQGVPNGNYPHFWIYGRCHDDYLPPSEDAEQQEEQEEEEQEQEQQREQDEKKKEEKEQEQEEAKEQQQDGQEGDKEQEEQGAEDGQASAACRQLKGRGEKLFSAHEVPPHSVMPVIARLVRQAVPLEPPPPPPPGEEGEEDEGDEDGALAVPEEPVDEEDYKPPPPPQQPPPQPHRGYQAPHQQRFMVGGRSGRSGPALGPSDERLKEELLRLGTSPTGIPIYRWRYRAEAAALLGGLAGRVFVGTTAQALLEAGRGDAVVKHAATGYWLVDYRLLDLEFSAAEPG